MYVVVDLSSLKKEQLYFISKSSSDTEFFVNLISNIQIRFKVTRTNFCTCLLLSW